MMSLFQKIFRTWSHSCISRKSDFPGEQLTARNAVDGVLSGNLQIKWCLFITCMCFFLSIPELLLLDIFFSSFIILLLLNKKGPVSFLLSMNVDIVSSSLGSKKWYLGQGMSKAFWSKLTGILFENKFVLCPQMNKACDISLVYIPLPLKYIKITLTVGKSRVLPWIIRCKHLYVKLRMWKAQKRVRAGFPLPYGVHRVHPALAWEAAIFVFFPEAHSSSHMFNHFLWPKSQQQHERLYFFIGKAK